MTKILVFGKLYKFYIQEKEHSYSTWIESRFVFYIKVAKEKKKF